MELAPHIRRLVGVGKHCWEIGSHDACNAMVLARLSRQPVLAFEFDPISCAKMRRNLILNPQYTDRVQIVRAYMAYECREQPKTLTIDAVVKQGASEPDVILIDTEGAEALILSGGRHVLSKYHPALIVETHAVSIERQCVEMLNEFGYDSHYFVERRSWFRENRNIDHNRWLIAPSPLAS